MAIEQSEIRKKMWVNHLIACFSRKWGRNEFVVFLARWIKVSRLFLYFSIDANNNWVRREACPSNRELYQYKPKERILSKRKLKRISLTAKPWETTNDLVCHNKYMRNFILHILCDLSEKAEQPCQKGTCTRVELGWTYLWYRVAQSLEAVCLRANISNRICISKHSNRHNMQVVFNYMRILIVVMETPTTERTYQQ